jgi:ribosomal protein S14
MTMTDAEPSQIRRLQFPRNPGKCDRCSRTVIYRKRTDCVSVNDPDGPVSRFYLCRRCTLEIGEL